MKCFECRGEGHFGPQCLKGPEADGSRSAAGTTESVCGPSPKAKGDRRRRVVSQRRVCVAGRELGRLAP